MLGRGCTSGLLLLLVAVHCVSGLGGVTFLGTGTSSTTVTAGTTDILSSIYSLFNTGLTGISIGTGATSGTGLESVAGSLALLAAALKAPLVALYQISAEVVVMVALILFISYIASLLGIDDFRKRTGIAGAAADEGSTDSSPSRSFFSRLLETEAVQHLTARVQDAIENFDTKEFLAKLDSRF
ncbi:uncharacterized protein LOC108682169 [Hyalella azteca]|uniref:Uncharacterized protein LOC108682169 n=1 Tax=Hyalella azteca TaxID=294128 RepID=A0A8B7PN50_HYAAZ|nr:uncharacterized protein LOC108682169 [Hyalella azteca]